MSKNIKEGRKTTTKKRDRRRAHLRGKKGACATKTRNVKRKEHRGGGREGKRFGSSPVTKAD